MIVNAVLVSVDPVTDKWRAASLDWGAGITGPLVLVHFVDTGVDLEVSPDSLIGRGRFLARVRLDVGKAMFLDPLPPSLGYDDVKRKTLAEELTIWISKEVNEMTQPDHEDSALRQKIEQQEKAIKEALEWLTTDYESQGATAEDVIDEAARVLRKVT